MLNTYLRLGLIAPFFFAFNSHSQVERNEEVDDSLETNTPVFITSLEDLDNNNTAGSNNSSGLLQASRDVYAATAGFNFSAARFRIRGYQSDMSVNMINGMPMYDMESGWAQWYKWGGLNDVTRYSETKAWLSSNPYHFGGIGGYANIDARASARREGTRISYALTNRAYNHRLMASYATGMQSNGWAFAFTVSGRYAYEGYVEGTSYEAFSYYAAAEKKVNDQHSLNFAVLGAPTTRGRASISIQEAYDLAGNNYYNSNWGYQTLADGTRIKRNARLQKSHLPVLIFNHDYKISKDKKLSTGVSFSFGSNGRTALNWYDAADPRPDYYKNLPSYYYGINDVANAAVAENNWASVDGRQLNWDQFYFANTKNTFAQENANGIIGNTVTGNRAKYIVENQRNNQMVGGLNSVFSHTIGNINLTHGIIYQLQRNHSFKTMDDLLGADFWVDVDQFAEQDFLDPNAAQNDVDTPNKIIENGDVFGWNYYIFNSKTELFNQAEFSLGKFDFYGALNLSHKAFWREGLYRNGRFLDNSFGKSDVNLFFNYAVKAGATYNISGRQFVSVNGAVMTQAPFSRSAYVSARTRDFTAPNLENEFIYTGDVNYLIRYPKLKMRLTYYYTERKNVLWSRSFYHDEYRSFVNYVMEGVDYLNHGLEFGIDGNIYGGLSANAVVAFGEYIYNSRPTASIYRDNSAEVIARDKVIYLQNFKVGGMPQTAASLGLKYSGKKYWFAGVNFNYFGDIYLDPNPDRRTEEAVANYVESDPQYQETIAQTQLNTDQDAFLNNAYNVSLFAGKSFKISNYFLNINVNINNLTNNRRFVTGGFEQLRYDSQDINRFPPRVGYLYGLNYFVMATLRF